MTAEGVPWVSFAGGGEKGRAAEVAVDLDPAHVGRDVLLCFPDGKKGVPVIVGIVRKAGESTLPRSSLDLVVDHDRVVLSARSEVVLRCGKATISLNAEGQVSIKGANVVSTAYGTNRIRGGNVQIN